MREIPSKIIKLAKKSVLFIIIVFNNIDSIYFGSTPSLIRDNPLFKTGYFILVFDIYSSNIFIPSLSHLYLNFD